MQKFEIRITRRAEKDIQRLTPKLKNKLYDILTEVISVDPLEGKKLLGDLAESYSYRLNLKDRIIYSIDSHKRIVYIERAKTHYGE